MHSKSFSRKIAKAISETLNDQEVSYITIARDEGYADPIRVWATIKHTKLKNSMDIDIWTMTSNVKHPVRHISGAYTEFDTVQTVNNLTKWVKAHIAEAI